MYHAWNTEGPKLVDTTLYTEFDNLAFVTEIHIESSTMNEEDKWNDNKLVFIF